jgi:pantetheine-phosphate adenylyltransferase
MPALARHALLPGTFDPPTLGHLDLAGRAARLFGRVTVGLAEHPSKQALFAVEERLALLRECLAGIEGAGVVLLRGLVVDAARELGCQVIVRGVRSGTDFDYEAQMAGTNRVLAPEVETALLVTRADLSHISSTLVRQIASMGGDASPLVPSPVAAALRARFG